MSDFTDDDEALPPVNPEWLAARDEWMRDRWLTELADEVASWEPVAGWLRSKRSGGDQ